MVYRFFIIIAFSLFFGYGLGNQIAIIGSGYVGLTMAAVLAHAGHTVICVDIDPKKIESLSQGHMPIYEPNLQERIASALDQKKLRFTIDLHSALDADIFYLCVGTPADDEGNCDTSFLIDAFKKLIDLCAPMSAEKIVCVKSTVPPATVWPLHEHVVRAGLHHITVVYNPEFLREGSALDDFYHHNPVVLGGESAKALDVMENLYRGFLPSSVQVIKTGFETAEIIKYSWNAFSAIRIAYVNEVSWLCKRLGGDIKTAVQGIALSEQLLPTHCIKPGPGYGGSCLPKDTQAFAKALASAQISPSLVHQVIMSNGLHKLRVINQIYELLPTQESPVVVAVLGLSFKANTDDIRYSPAQDVIKALLAKGVVVKAFDPQAANNMARLFPQVDYCATAYDAINNAHLIVSLTDWPVIARLDFEQAARLCAAKVMFDTRNMYNPELVKAHGFEYYNMGACK